MTAWSSTGVLVALVGATVVVLLLLALIVSAALRSGGKAGSGAAVKTLRLLGAESLRLSFRRAVKLVEANLASASERYSLSWTLLLNDSAVQEVPLAASGLPSAFSTDSSMAVATQGIGWHFFDKGLVVQLRTNYLGPATDTASLGAGAWDELLTLCRNYRPQRPFDAIVLAIPAAALLDVGPEGEAGLRDRAQALNRRLWQAQNRLALRFPVHLVITECETIPGFARFGAAVPDALRRAILGWVSPFELVTPFMPQWVDSAMDQVVKAVADSSAELAALAPVDADSTAYFLLPAELERLRAGMKMFCEELMRLSAYHEPFLLRGIYLTGDSSPAAILLASDGAPLAVDGFTLAPVDQSAPVPVFLRDIFERKVFAEVGLVRSSRQRMRRPAARRLGYWMALALPLAWAVGLVFATVRLSGLQADILAAVKWIDDPASSQTSGPLLSPYQRTARAALEHADLLSQWSFYAIAMPGSWPVFNRLFDQRLHDLIERRFAENAVQVLNAAALNRIAQLTGTPYVRGEAHAGQIVQCGLPRGWPDASASEAATGLNLINLAEYKVLMSFLARLHDADQAVQALLRLEAHDGPAPQSSDLALAMNVLLKTRLPSRSSSTAELYRAAARTLSENKLDGQWMGQVAKCTVRRAGEALYLRLFDHNTLLTEEKNIQTSLAQLRQVSSHSSEFASQLPPWQQLQHALLAQKALMVPGEGEWMHHEELMLGVEQDNLIRSVRINGLLGDSVVATLGRQALDSHEKLRHGEGSTIKASGMLDGSGIGGLDWSDKGWHFTPARQALADAVSALLAPPYMVLTAPMPLATINAGQTAQWDPAQLERGAGLVDARTAFRAGAFLRFQTDLQAAAGALVDAALAAAGKNALTQALSAGPQALPGAASDAQRNSVLRVRAWLASLGAGTAAADIDQILVQDATTRLTHLDAYLTAAQLYMPAEGAFDGWQGRKGAMADVFGGGDIGGLHAYIEKQQDFIETSVGQAEGVLTELDSTTSAGTSGQRVQPDVVRRWLALQKDQRRYQLKSPTSSRLALENFILTGSADIDVENCTGKTLQRQSPGASDDLFSRRLQVLRASLIARCLALAGGSEQRQWQQFADAWNRDLAPRAPFMLVANGKFSEPADRAAIGALLKLYDGAPANRTNAQVRRVRALLAPLYPLDVAQTGGLDVAVDFRANAGVELHANQIIDWTLTIGRASLRQLDPARPLRWEPGMPVILSLRLARDGDWLARRDPDQGAMTVADERTVNYRFDDPWALITFINTYREAEAAGDDGRASLLKFTFGLMPAASKGIAGVLDEKARVFLRLRVSPPGKQEALAWPARLSLAVPYALPPLSETVQGAL